MSANKLTSDEVQELKYFWRLGATRKNLSLSYGISYPAVHAHTAGAKSRELYRKKYYASESVHVKAQRKAWKKSPKGIRCVKNTQLKASYGITLAEYELKLAEQKGCCAICEAPAAYFKKGLHLDHSHTTGKIRGLLCPGCNTNLVAALENPLLEKARTYLRGY